MSDDHLKIVTVPRDLYYHEIAYVRGLEAEIERLREQVASLQASSGYETSIAQVEIERLREEVETWRDRYEAERKDHKATIKAWDEERSGL